MQPIDTCIVLENVYGIDFWVNLYFIYCHNTLGPELWCQTNNGNSAKLIEGHNLWHTLVKYAEIRKEIECTIDVVFVAYVLPSSRISFPIYYIPFRVIATWAH